MPHTRQSVSDFLLDRIENQDLPDKIIEALRPFDGKMVTTRILDKLPGGKAEWTLRRQYGMTNLQNNAYWRTGGSHEYGISLLMAHTEASFPLDLVKLEKDNPAYFSARKERNHARIEARNDATALDKMAAVLNRIERAKSDLAKATAELEQLTEYQSVFNPDKYELEKACGLERYRSSNGKSHIG